ncbi:hypothetical protein T440DRAFT_522623 [Plenodomus tracheiphilus IPT5]|uniref:Uncharacterized protein n=1 Tax=Plenodomus tracheiphilus IPT5 TaxID=1408161 RepID=A0A6A7AQB7_9PLEO|nr:hypothetical protein T440DRAFT_522623 [Plenodomus tracheiphilus IPT5]
MAPSIPPTPPQDPSSMSTLPHFSQAFSAEPNSLQRALHEQSTRITSLERTEQNNIRLSRELEEARSRIDALERHNADLAARRREAVAQFLNMRPLYHESANAFETRARDVQVDDLESMLCIHGSTSMAVINAQQRAIAALSQQARGLSSPSMYYGQLSNQQGLIGSGLPSHNTAAAAARYAYPTAYMQDGYCRLHRLPYRCRICGP